MKVQIPTLLVFVSIVAISAPLSAQQRVYKWTDAQGVVHYSQTAPDKIPVEARDLKNRDPKTAPTPEATAQAPKPAESDACAAAKRNRDLLAGSGPVARDMDGDGKPDVMTEQQRASALAQSEFQVTRYCVAPVAPAATSEPSVSEPEAAPETGPEPEPTPAASGP